VVARKTHSKGFARPRISSRSVGATGCGESADWVDGDEPVDGCGGLTDVGEDAAEVGERRRRADEVRSVGRPSRAILADDDRLPAELERPHSHPAAIGASEED
jgi:hypothetical protein